MIDAGVHQQLGTLVAEVKNLREDLRRSEDRSDAGRLTMTRRMDEVVERMRTLEGSMMLVKDDIASMKPVTDDVRKWKLMGMGALGVIGMAGAALGVTFARCGKTRADADESWLEYFRHFVETSSVRTFRRSASRNRDTEPEALRAKNATNSVVPEKGEITVTAAYQPHRPVRLDDVGFVDPAAEPVDELVRYDAADGRLGEPGARLATIGDAAGDRLQIGGIAHRGRFAAAQEHERAQDRKSVFHDDPRHLCVCTPPFSR